MYLDEALKAIVNTQREKRKADSQICPFVFSNVNSTGQIKVFRRSWLTACKNANIGHKIFHDLTQTAVRNMIRSSVPERVAMVISGHKTHSVFDRCNIVNDADIILAAKKQENCLKNQSTGTIEDSQKHQKVRRKT